MDKSITVKQRVFYIPFLYSLFFGVVLVLIVIKNFSFTISGFVVSMILVLFVLIIFYQLLWKISRRRKVLYDKVSNVIIITNGIMRKKKAIEIGDSIEVVSFMKSSVFSKNKSNLILLKGKEIQRSFFLIPFGYGVRIIYSNEKNNLVLRNLHKQDAENVVNFIRKSIECST